MQNPTTACFPLMGSSGGLEIKPQNTSAQQPFLPPATEAPVREGET